MRSTQTSNIYTARRNRILKWLVKQHKKYYLDIFYAGFDDKYRKVVCVGQGAFGEAWKVESRLKNKTYIMKEISIRSWSDRDMEMGRNEISILKSCEHPSVVKYKDDFYERGKLLIVMEFCSGGDLANFISQQRRPLDESKVIEMFTQMTSGLQYIHAKKILHRDLKPANIFLSSSMDIKIGDFGISKSLSGTRQMANTFCRTPCYMAPEVIGGKPYNHKVKKLFIFLDFILIFRLMFGHLDAFYMKSAPSELLFLEKTSCLPFQKVIMKESLQLCKFEFFQGSTTKRGFFTFPQKYQNWLICSSDQIQPRDLLLIKFLKFSL